MDSFASSTMKHFVAFLPRFRFLAKLIFLLLFDQHQVFFVYLTLLPSYIALRKRHNQVRNLLCNHLFSRMQYFECYHMFLDHFLPVDQKVLSIIHNIVVFHFDFQKKISGVWCSKSLKTQIN